MSLAVPVISEVQSTRHVKGRRGSSSNTSTESQFGTKMYLYGREICFLLAIIFTSYAALQNSSAKVSSVPAAVPFFRGSPHVTDYFRGQLGRAFERVSEADVSFVMFYAPWDADSQELRKHFVQTAQYLHQQVHFAAINCWQPLSECRSHFTKIQSFPVLITYVQGAKGLPYKGVREFAHMAAFLHRVLRPIERLHSTAGLVDMMARHDAVVVAFLAFRGPLGARGFTAFHSAAQRFLERDPRREVGFAVVTDNETARRWDVLTEPTVRMYLWNETLEYGYRGQLSSDAIASWVSSSLHQAVAWLAPPGVKSLTLSPYADEGAVLVLFTPLNPLLGSNRNYQALREVALEYYNCEDNVWVDDLARWLPQIRLESSVRLSSLHRRCLAEPRPAEHSVTVSVTTAGRRDNASQRCRRRSDVGPALPCELAFAPRDPRRLQTSMLDGDDARGAAALTSSWHRAECRRLAAARTLPGFPAAEPTSSPRDAPPWGVRGLACRSNRTLSLLAMDSLQFAHFAAALGVEVAPPTFTGAAVFSAHDESSFAMPHPVSARSLADFLRSFSEGRADRSRRSSADSIAPNRFPEQPADACKHGTSAVCVPELTARTFQDTVMDNEKSVVVLYHSPFCAFCGSVSHAFLATARTFRAVPDLAFARIDGENNDLPWELTMHHYPTIIFFPAHAKSESRVFPVSLPATTERLAGFVLANLPFPGAGLAARAGLCAAAANHVAAVECVRRLRRLCLDEIDATLKEHRNAGAMWRAAQAARLSRSALASHRFSLRRRNKHLLFRLQHLRQVHLLLGSTQRLVPDSATLNAIHRSFVLYRRALSFDQSQRSFPPHESVHQSGLGAGFVDKEETTREDQQTGDISESNSDVSCGNDDLESDEMGDSKSVVNLLKVSSELLEDGDLVDLPRERLQSVDVTEESCESTSAEQSRDYVASDGLEVKDDGVVTGGRSSAERNEL